MGKKITNLRDVLSNFEPIAYEELYLRKVSPKMNMRKAPVSE